ncbi:SDR family oxidoreductase [Aliivibrio fischeri]|uniref:SDR family oxidoreductase n=1 Tax=Aliivibrio fischeri TaxID=668 RepID=UPI0018C4A1AE|nr:sugar nucleotide-binding protein [Aliivibrio fischeri]
MNILLLGHNGFIGTAINNEFQQLSYNVSYLNFKIDNNNLENVLSLISDTIINKKIDIVINSIAMANVDVCELRKEECELINTTFVINLVDLIIKSKIKLLHISSNAVYDGECPPYSEGSLEQPVNYYGLCKLKADKYIQEHMNNFVILRPITLYGARDKNQRHNPVTFYLEKIINKEKLQLVDDNIVNMLHIDDFVLAVKKVIDNNLVGLFNLSGDISECRYSLGLRICRLLNVDEDSIERISGEFFSVPAKRPKNTSFNNEKMKGTLGIIPKELDSSLLEIIDNVKF